MSSEDEDNLTGGDNINAARSVCTVFESTLNSCDGIPNEHILTVTALLIEKLGRCTFTKVLCFVILNILAKRTICYKQIFCFSKSLFKFGVSKHINIEFYLPLFQETFHIFSQRISF